MRALLERSRLARGGVAILASAAVLALVHAAVAGDDLGLRRSTFLPEAQPVSTHVDLSTGSLPRHRHARRIWAASRLRPLRIARSPLTRGGTMRGRFARGSDGHRIRLAGSLHRRHAIRTARLRPSAEPQVVFPRLVALPTPSRPALVSIYQDRTLRAGDAVMMADGIHVFHGVGAWPYRPRDFVRLTLVSALDWHLRQTLDSLDRNPPTRWSSTGSWAG